MADTVNIEQFLREEGFDAATARAQARALLEERGLTRPGKTAMAITKLPDARTAFATGFARTCGSPECGEIAGDDARRKPVTVLATACQVCGGSNNRRAALALARRLKAERLHRLLIVGGTPTLHSELEGLLAPHGISLRYVDGATGSHSARDAAPAMQWAQVMVVWGASPLPHKVSRLYTDAPPSHVRVVKFARRGIEALCREVLRSLG